MIRKIVRGTGTVFIVTGLLLLYFVAYELIGTSLQTRAHQAQLAEAFAGVLDDPKVGQTSSPSPEPTVDDQPEPKRVNIKPIARIRIPRINVDDYVVEGVTLSRLAYGPGRYPDSAPIGGKGSSAIAGHRTGWGSPFVDLDKLRAGDAIVLIAPAGTFTYRVTSSTVVGPNDGWVIGGDPKSNASHKLTLTTCTPKYTSRDRLIVWADLVKTEPPAR